MLALALWMAVAGTVGAQPFGPPASREELSVQLSSLVLDEVMAIPGSGIPQGLLANANAVAIIPNVLKGGFVVGVRHGRGVVLVRGENGRWQPPHFVSLTSGSVGWQAGVQATDLILVFQTPQSVRALMQGRMTLGVDAAAAAGPVGRQATAATDTSLSAEILSYSRSRGLFAGFAVDGASIQLDGLADATYYRGQQVQGGAPLPASALALIDRLNRYSGAPAAAAPAGLPSGPADALRPQLAAAWQRLADILDPQWVGYLQPPAEAMSAGPPPDERALVATLQRFDRVGHDPQYTALANRPEFAVVRHLLGQALDVRRRELGGDALALPPPPGR